MRKASLLFLAVISLPAAANARAKVTKQARVGDVASGYSLTERGDLFRQIGKLRCQITSGVTEFKVAQHPADGGAIYFVKAGDLKVLVAPAYVDGNCPKADVRTVTEGVVKYALVTDPASPAVLMTLDREGTFRSIGPATNVEIPGVADFSMNACAGQQGHKFSSYGAFVIDRFGA
jgi:hypothetical protein